MFCLCWCWFLEADGFHFACLLTVVAPEVIELKGASPASDIWSLGCTVIELLTGRPPYAEIQNTMSGQSSRPTSALGFIFSPCIIKMTLTRFFSPFYYYPPLFSNVPDRR